MLGTWRCFTSFRSDPACLLNHYLPLLVVISHVRELISAVPFLEYKNGLPAKNAVALPVIVFDRLCIPKTSLHFRAKDRVVFLHEIGFRHAAASVGERKLCHRGDRFPVLVRHRRFKLRPERRKRFGVLLNAGAFDRCHRDHQRESRCEEQFHCFFCYVPNYRRLLIHATTFDSHFINVAGT
jgi:hypothetical protein